MTDPTLEIRADIRLWLITSGRMEKMIAQREANAKLRASYRAHWLTSPVADGEREVVG